MFEENVRLDTYSTMKTGGVAKRACFPSKAEELVRAVKQLRAEGTPYVVLGRCSNVLFPDGDVPFVPVFTAKMADVTVTADESGVLVYAASGVSLTKLAMDMCKAGYAGLVFAYGIPGSVGGAVFMNAGAYGGEMKDVVASVDVYDPGTDRVETVDAKARAFGYRASAFADGRRVILGARLRLLRGDAKTLVAEAKELMQKRLDKQPLDKPSCGSAFKRPEGYFAGKLIEDCGLKGFRVGGAGISEKHAGFAVNEGGATSEDVKALLKTVAEKVKAATGVTLEPEIRFL